MTEHETIADIVAEMRGIRVREFQDYADRIEAAHRREVATTKESLAVGNSGDCAKLREAMLSIKADILKRRSENVWYISDSDILEKIDAALADRAVRLMDAKRRDPEKPKRKYDAKKRAPKLKRVEADA